MKLVYKKEIELWRYIDVNLKQKAVTHRSDNVLVRKVILSAMCEVLYHNYLDLTTGTTWYSQDCQWKTELVTFKILIQLF